MTSQLNEEELLPKHRLFHWGRIVLGCIILGLLALIAYCLSQGKISYNRVPEFFVSDIVLRGLYGTIILAIAAQGMAIILGTLIALMKISKNPVLSSFAAGYIWIFRGLPVLLQLLMWYSLALIFPNFTIAIPFSDTVLFTTSMNNVMTPFFAAFLGLGLNEAAYMAEIVRAGLKSVDKGQMEAARSIGETPFQCMWRIILPQAMRLIVPPTGNDFINMLKGTSIVSIIGFVELMRAANNISSSNFLVMETLLAIAAWYMILVTVASIGQYYIERYFDQGNHRSGSGGPHVALAILRRLLSLLLSSRR